LLNLQVAELLHTTAKQAQHDLYTQEDVQAHSKPCSLAKVQSQDKDVCGNKPEHQPDRDGHL